jgi:hypothetical protein
MFMAEIPFLPRRPDGVVVRQVHADAMATDPNYLARYGEVMADETAAGLPSNEPVAPPRPVPGPVAAPADPGYTADGVPTFESVREKIENRYGTAIGAAELAAETPEGRSVEEQYEARQQAAADRLEQIRRSMRND